MKVSEDIWKFYQQHLGYSDEEMKKFRENRRNEDVISKASALMNKTIIVEVVDSHGCNSQHKVGDKFYFDGAGNILTKLCPKRICFGALHSVLTLVYAAQELFYAGVDPNEMRFKRTGCVDVGVNCGGWGHIVMELRVEERKREQFVGTQLVLERRALNVETLGRDQLKEILIKNWMTHDAMWFYHCWQECGIEKTNKINKAAVRAMGIIEIKRIQKAVDIQKVETFEDFKSLIGAAWDIVKGEFMKSSFSLPSKSVLRGDFERCFAYEGMKRIGVIEQYECGIFERIYGWFDGIGIKYTVSPHVEGCMMHTEGRCFREIMFTVDKQPEGSPKVINQVSPDT